MDKHETDNTGSDLAVDSASAGSVPPFVAGESGCPSCGEILCTLTDDSTYCPCGWIEDLPQNKQI
jgi:hypothetical protein